MVTAERKMSEIIGKDIFTERGSYCGKVADVRFDLAKFRVDAIIIDAAKGSFLAGVVGGKKGVIVPYPMVKAVDDIVLIKHIPGPLATEEEKSSKAEA